MELTTVEDWSQSALAVRDLYEATEAIEATEATEATAALSSLTELERLLDQELKDESPGTVCSGLPVSEDRVEQEDELLR